MDGHFLLLLQSTTAMFLKKAAAVLTEVTCSSQTLKFSTKTRTLKSEGLHNRLTMTVHMKNYIRNLDAPSKPSSVILSSCLLCYYQWFKAGTTSLTDDLKHRNNWFPSHGNLGASGTACQENVLTEFFRAYRVNIFFRC